MSLIWKEKIFREKIILFGRDLRVYSGQKGAF